MERTPKQAEESFAGLLGGARPNSGTPKGYVKSADLKALDKEKARHEKIKADRAELAYKIELGKYLSREAFKQAHATSIALLASSIRCIPDKLGMRFGLEPKVVQLVEEFLDDALNAHADDMLLFFGSGKEESDG